MFSVRGITWLKQEKENEKILSRMETEKEEVDTEAHKN